MEKAEGLGNTDWWLQDGHGDGKSHVGNAVSCDGCAWCCVGAGDIRARSVGLWLSGRCAVCT